jgi:hypothetical protein
MTRRGMSCARRLDVEDVQRGARQDAGVERLDQRGVIDQRRPRGVDDE